MNIKDGRPNRLDAHLLGHVADEGKLERLVGDGIERALVAEVSDEWEIGRAYLVMESE